MKARLCLAALAAMVATQSQGLTPPSASDGPIKLLTCTVTPQGVLEAWIDNQTGDAMDCIIRCNYQLGGTALSHTFNVTVPAGFNGRVGRMDTSGAKAGDYSGDILGECKKSPR